jgi:putative molybdopterin biosynthesis protein
VVPQEYFETEAIQILLDIINSPAFKQRVEALGGYNTQNTGEIIDT